MAKVKTPKEKLADRDVDLSALGIKCGSKKLRALCDELDRDDSKIAKSRGDKSATLKAMEEDHHIHKSALKAALKVRNMDAVQAGEFLRHFDAYLDVLGVRDQAELAFEEEQKAEKKKDAAAKAEAVNQPAAGSA